MKGRLNIEALYSLFSILCNLWVLLSAFAKASSTGNLFYYLLNSKSKKSYTGRLRDLSFIVM